MVRAEITGRKPRVTTDRAKRRKIPKTASLIVEPDSGAIESTAYSEPNSSSRTKAMPIRGPPMPAFALTVQQFCQTHQLSESMFYKLKAQGRGPVEMAYGRRRAISLESAARWRAAREAETTQAAE